MCCGQIRWSRSDQYTYLCAAAVTDLNDFVHPKLRKRFIDSYDSPPWYAHNSRQTVQDLYRTLRLPKNRVNQPCDAEIQQRLTIFTWSESASTWLYTATVRIPSFFAVRMTRQAISPLENVKSKLRRELGFCTCSPQVSCQNGVYGQEMALTLCVHCIEVRDLSRRRNKYAPDAAAYPRTPSGGPVFFCSRCSGTGRVDLKDR
jgi:hypothetical protein